LENGARQLANGQMDSIPLVAEFRPILFGGKWLPGIYSSLAVVVRLNTSSSRPSLCYPRRSISEAAPSGTIEKLHKNNLKMVQILKTTVCALGLLAETVAFVPSAAKLSQRIDSSKWRLEQYDVPASYGGRIRSSNATDSTFVVDTYHSKAPAQAEEPIAVIGKDCLLVVW
jgi:hypothetical protein